MILPPTWGLKTTKLVQSSLTFISEQQYWLKRGYVLLRYLLIMVNKEYSFLTQSTMEQQMNQMQELYNRIPQQIIAQFSTQLQQYQLQHEKLQLSTELDEEQLNHMVKMMIPHQEMPRFQFVVEGYLLRGKLKSHIIRHSLTPEQTIQIQFVLAYPPLNHQINTPAEDWVSAMHTLQAPEGVSAVVASLYNGNIEVYLPSLQKIGSFKADLDPLKALAFMPSQTQNQYYCLSGGLGEQLQVHSVRLSANNLESQLISSNALEGSINSIEVSPGHDMHVATGGSEGCLSIWQIPKEFGTLGTHNIMKNKKKKAVLDLNVLPVLATSSIHKGTIESISWLNNQQIVSSSSAHEIGITDIVKMCRTETILTRDSVVTSLDTDGVQVLSAHEDGQIRMWDRRDPTRPASTYKAHSKWTSSIKFGTASHTFASGSYDHTVKIWDSRCGFPVQNLHSQQQKVLAIQWLSGQRIVSGGSDASLHLYSTE